MKKILFIHHAQGFGGAFISMLKLIKSLDIKLFEVEVLLVKDSIASDKLKENGIKYSIAKSKFYSKYYRYFEHSEAGYIKWYNIYSLLKHIVLWVLSRYYFSKIELKNHQYDIVHLNSSVLTDWIYPAKQKGNVVYHVREPFKNSKYDVLAKFLRRQMKYADKIIAISKDNALRINLPPLTEVVYNYAEVPNSEIDINSYSSKKVLYLGGDFAIKGFYTMVDSLQFLDKDIKVYFAGSYRQKRKRNIFSKFIINIIKILTGYGKKHTDCLKIMRSSSNAVELGMIDNVGDYINQSCCVLSPFSKPHFARPIIESFLYKKPVIATDVEGMSEIVQNNVNGIIIPKDNPIKLAQAINDMCYNSFRIKFLGENGYNVAIVDYTPNNIKKIEYIYTRL